MTNFMSGNSYRLNAIKRNLGTYLPYGSAVKK